MGRVSYLAMKADGDLVDSDLRELGVAAKKLVDHAFMLAGGLGFGATFLKFLASFGAIYLLILDGTKWRTNMLTSLLVPYIFFALPASLFSLLRGEFGKWIAFAAIVLRLLFPRHFPDWLEMPGSLILLLVCAPDLLAHNIRDNILSSCICLYLGCYLLQEHVRASGGFRNSFTKSHGAGNSIGIILLLVYPAWCLIVFFI